MQRNCLLICCLLLWIGALGCSRKSNLHVSVYITTPDGRTIPVSEVPIHVTHVEDAGGRVSLRTSARFRVQPAYYQTLLYTEAPNTTPRVYTTDSQGRATLENVGDDEFIIAVVTNVLFTPHCWIASPQDAIDHHLDFSSRNECGARMDAILSHYPKLNKQCVKHFKDAIAQTSSEQNRKIFKDYADAIHRLPVTLENPFVSSLLKRPANLDTFYLDFTDSDCFLDCRPDSVVVYPGEVKIGLAELQKKQSVVTRAFEASKLMTNGQKPVVLIRPRSSDTLKLLLDKKYELQADVSWDVLDENVILGWDEARQTLCRVLASAQEQAPLLQIIPRKYGLGLESQTPLFECRSGEVFYLDRESIDKQMDAAVKAMTLTSPLQFKFSTDLYQASVVFQKRDMFYILDAIQGQHGENAQTLTQSTSKFYHRTRSGNERTPAFIVRNDSFEIFRQSSRTLPYSGNLEFVIVPDDEPIRLDKSLAKIVELKMP